MTKKKLQMAVMEAAFGGFNPDAIPVIDILLCHSIATYKIAEQDRLRKLNKQYEYQEQTKLHPKEVQSDDRGDYIDCSDLDGVIGVLPKGSNRCFTWTTNKSALTQDILNCLFVNCTTTAEKIGNKIYLNQLDRNLKCLEVQVVADVTDLGEDDIVDYPKHFGISIINYAASILGKLPADKILDDNYISSALRGGFFDRKNAGV